MFFSKPYCPYFEDTLSAQERRRAMEIVSSFTTSLIFWGRFIRGFRRQHQSWRRFVFVMPLTEEMASSEPQRNSIRTWQWRPVDEYKCVINLNYEFKWNRLLLSYRSLAYVAWDTLTLKIAREWRGSAYTCTHTQTDTHTQK